MAATYMKGVAIASAAAGPLFLLAAATTALPDLSLTASDTGPAALFALAAAVASVPIGFALALVPNLFGAALLAALGRGNDGARLPVFWALVGAGIGGLIDTAIVASGGAPAFTPLFTLVALACALLCRASTRWTD